jgi:hypothetical protein
MMMVEPLNEFHDAELIAIELDRQAKLMALRFILPNRHIKIIRLEGVSHLRANDIVSQNVVSRVLVSSNNKFSADEISHWTKWVTTLTDTSSFATEDQLAMIQEQISQSQYFLLVLEPSWGAEIVVIAKSYSIS